MMPGHRCDPHLMPGGDRRPGPLTISRCVRLLLSWEDDFSGVADSVSAEFVGCPDCSYAVAMGAVGTAVSLLRTIEAERGEDPRPSLQLHLQAALDQLAREDAG